MTLVEFFEKTAIENICASLIDMPDRIVFIGNKSMEKHIARYEEILASKGLEKTETIKKFVSNSRLDNAVKILSEIVETYDDCVFDITGGEEILNVALGIVCEKYPLKDIQIQKINIKDNVIYFCDKNGVTTQKGNPSLSIEQNVKLYGGKVLFGGINQDDTYRWDLTPDFLNDFEKMWKICKGNFGYWNLQIGLLKTINENGVVSCDQLTVTISQGALENALKKEGRKFNKTKGIINALCAEGLITNFDDSDDITITYKNEQVKRCLSQEGQILEMKIYITAKNLSEDDGVRPVYEDALNGVVIDWDGKNEPFDTENEIDVMLMHDIVPVFISCKNGDFSAEELYKLNTVAERFGGKYAKKVLVTTAIDNMRDKGKYLTTRANDMRIQLIKENDILDDAKLSKRLKTLWEF
ncbi:MAG: DUF1887 family protein [Clostridia bacterium]|nr:DUF1887 family protein [Clostridia bacterium]